MKKNDPLRAQLVKLLNSGEAHVDFDRAVKGIPGKLLGVRPKGLPYSLWQLLEHIRLAQRDLLDFCRNPKYRAPKWPEDYWPAKPVPPNALAWGKSVAAFRADRRAFARMITRRSLDLYAKIPHGDGQTCLREVFLAADHTAFHLGEIVAVRRLLGAWK